MTGERLRPGVSHSRRAGHLQAILTAVSDAVVVIDDRGRVEIFNLAAEKIFGYRADEVVGENVSILMPENHAAAHDQYIADYAIHGEQKVIGKRRQLSGRRKDGTTFPLELTVAEVKTPEGTVYAGTCHDITARLQALRTIDMYATTIEMTPDIVSVSSPDGMILALNGAGRRFLGVQSNDDLSGLRFRDFHDEPSQTRLAVEALPTASVAGVWEGETTFVAADATLVPMSQVISVCRGASGQIEYLCMIARDLSEIQRNERARTEFLVSAMSHELRTPLTSIRAALELLSAGKFVTLSGVAGDMVRVAKENTDRLAHLVNNILELEEFRSGHAELSRRLVDPNHLAQRALAEVVVEATRANTAIEVAVADSLPPLHVDGDRLVHALASLLNNGIKFSGAGGHLTLTISEPLDGVVEMAVADDGVGVPKGKGKSIFQPFRQADSSDRRAAGGIGIGLAIVEAIATAHGGSVEFESEVGVGSTFRVRIPASEEDSAARDAPGEAAA